MIKYHTKNGEITLDTTTNMYTVWDETYSNTLCVTRDLHVAEHVLRRYATSLDDNDPPQVEFDFIQTLDKLTRI